MSIYTCLCGDFNFFVFYNSVTTEVFPLNWLECGIRPEKIRDQVFYRRFFEGSLKFGGRGLKDDYDLFRAIEQSNPCGRIDFLILKDLDVYWEGYFAINEGEFDHDECTFTVKPNVADAYEDWETYGELEFNILDVAPAVTVICGLITYTRNRWLMDVIEYIANEVFPGCTLASNFFTFTTDYVTLLSSKNRYLTIAAKADIKRPSSTDPVQSALLSFNSLMAILRMFNVYWKYDDTTGVLRIEHVMYWESVAGLDLRSDKMASGSNKYKYKKEEMPFVEKFSFMESLYPDFLTGIVWYESPCVAQGIEPKVSEFSVNITTDIEMIQNNADSVSDNGFVILCNYLSGGNYYTYFNAGILNTTPRYNVFLGWSYLLLWYHRHNRVLLEGYMNLDLTTFFTAKKNKIQEINTIVCNDFDENDYITTELGETYFGGQKGYIEKALIHPSGEVNFSLLYGEEDNPHEGAPEVRKTLKITADMTDLIISELSEPNIYDTYYSIWTDDGLPTESCEQIMIPAGTVYQEDHMTNLAPTTLKWNFTDDSLDGWFITVNKVDTYDTCTDVDCDSGAPAPPAPPAAPTITAHSQSGFCEPVHIDWTTEVGATYYELWRNPDLDGNPNWIKLYEGADNDYDDVDAGFRTGETLTYKALAGNIGGESAFSADYIVDDVLC